MKQLRYAFLLSGLVWISAGCNKIKTDDISFVGTASAPADLALVLKSSTDNSGMVTIKPDGAGAAHYDIYFGDETTEPARVPAGKSITHRYKEGDYSVKVVGTGITGLQTENTFPLRLTFREPENLKLDLSSEVHTLRLSATADYAKGGFRVYFGENPAEPPRMMAEGAFLTHTYAKAGTYEVKVEALSGGTATSSITQTVRIYNALDLPMTFEDPDVWYNWGDFGGSQTQVVANPFPSGINTSATVGKIIKHRDQTWAGNFIILTEPLDLSQKHVLKVKVYSPRVGMRVQLQLERNGDNSFQDHREVLTTKANQWEELVFDFAGADNSKKLQNILFFLDNGALGDGSAYFTLLFDDITLN